MSEGDTSPIPPRVFISYARYDPAHAARVLELAYALEADGLAVECDQFHGQQLIDWPRSCAERLDPENTDFVLMVCSAEYCRRIEGKVARDQGRGVFWEGALIYGYLYEEKGNARFVPLLLDDEPESSLPRVVVNWNRFRLRRFGVETGDQGYEDLYRLLTGQPATPRPNRGTLKTLPPRPLHSPDAAATTPAQFWPDHMLDSQGVETTDCNSRLYAICVGGELPHQQERRALWQAVKKQRPSSFLAWQLANVARWSAPEYLEVDERFTLLRVHVRVRESAEAPAEKQEFSFETLAEAMSAVFDDQMAPAGVIFAPPGGGKSTLLRHHQLQQARRLTDSERLVFYVQLRDYRPAKRSQGDQDPEHQPALAWLESQWRKETGPAATPLVAFMRQGTLTLLLDGLNEIPRDSDEAYRARVGEWRELVDLVDDRYPGVRLLFACRPLDYSQRLDAGRHTRLPEIEVQGMEPERIKTFIDRRINAEIAGHVWTQLQDQPALELYSSPYYLSLLLGQIDIGAEEIQIPKNRAALFSGMVRERLRRECQKGTARFANPSLLSDRNRTVLMSGKPREHWLPDDTPFFEALAALAFHIQDAGASDEPWGSLRWKKARQVMGAALEGKADTDGFLHAGCDLGLFEDEAAQADTIRFVH